jgi:hypothetical protein
LASFTKASWMKSMSSSGMSSSRMIVFNYWNGKSAGPTIGPRTSRPALSLFLFSSLHPNWRSISAELQRTAGRINGPTS